MYAVTRRLVILAGWFSAGLAAIAIGAALAPAADISATVSLHGLGDAMPGSIRFVDTRFGLLLEPDLASLVPGLHAAHIHEHGDCGASAAGEPLGNAGDHFDPAATGRHAGPYGNGHLGDLPNLIVEPDGTATLPMLAPRPTVADIRGRALILHAGADRYDEHAMHHHGKGGDRMYCGIIR